MSFQYAVLIFLNMQQKMKLQIICMLFFSEIDVHYIFSYVDTGGTGVLWWLYVKMSPDGTLPVEQLQIAKDNHQALLIYAIAATIFTVSI